ncbi:MAG: hypothetical protein QOH21_615, partial [Acidobacteriota bacterium]|nr:hypothetical protein [Acidobacteriota bacterium]
MTALMLVTNDEQDLSINVTVSKEVLAEQLDSLSIVTAYAHAIANTVINPVSSPPETWYGPLSDSLSCAKTHAQTWIAEIAPDIGSKIPQSIIDYDNTFTEAATRILRIIGTKDTLSDAEKKQVIDLISDVLSEVEDQKSEIKRVSDKVLKLSNDFACDYKALAEGSNSAAVAVDLAKSDQLEIENKIQELQTKLDDARSKVTISGIGLGLSIFIAVAGFALAVATGGAAAPLVVGAIGLIGTGVAATFTGIFTAEISSLISQIAERQTALTNKKRQVTALSGLLDTVTKLKTHNEAAKQALTSVSTMWNTLGLKLDAVLKNL